MPGLRNLRGFLPFQVNRYPGIHASANVFRSYGIIGKLRSMENKEFNPRIVAFVCNWCTYAGADLTGTSRIKYATNVKIVRFPCTGRIDYMLLLKSFAEGADGIIVSGCHPNDCHYTSGNFHARRRWVVFRNMLDFLGIDIRRITFSWVSAAEGAKWAELL